MRLMWRSWHMAQEKGWQFDKGQTIYILVAWSCLTWTHKMLASKDCHPHAQKDLLSSVQGETFWPLPQHCVLALEMRHSWTMCTLSRKQKKCHAQCTLPQKPTQNEEYVVLWLPLRCFLVSFTQRKTGPFCRTPTETGHLGISHLLSIFCFLLLWFPRSQNLLLPDLSAGSNRILNPRQKKWNGIISKDWGK